MAVKTQTAVKVRRCSASATKRSTFEKKYPLWDEYAAKVIPAERRAELQRSARRKLIEMDLRELRKFAGRTQVELAEATKMTQAQVSRLEKRPDHLLSTLRRYVEALGGQLEITAAFGDRSVRVRALG